MSMKSLIEIEGISVRLVGVFNIIKIWIGQLDFSHISPVRTYSQKKKGQSALRLYIDTFVHPNSITVRSRSYIINRLQ